MGMKSKQFLNISLLTTVLSLSFHSIIYADNNIHTSLYGSQGYLTTPSAYITDGSWSFHYSYLPKGAGPFHKGQSDNWIFTSSLGLFPFMECFFSVYVSPEYEWKLSGRGDTTRSPGVKVKIIKEKIYIPAIALGLFDPNLDDTKLDYGEFAAQSISSTFVVFSKNKGKSSISIGYGFEKLFKENTRLIGVFGGIKFNIYNNIYALIDYDGDDWSEGISFQWYGFNASIANVGEKIPSYRIGYNLNLHIK